MIKLIDYESNARVCVPRIIYGFTDVVALSSMRVVSLKGLTDRRAVEQRSYALVTSKMLVPIYVPRFHYPSKIDYKS
jgi:hypothetical protein